MCIGLVTGPFIGENTRMICDIIDYCGTFREKGILIILDFSKAFDTIEWPFIEDTLKRFNFGETFIDFIKLCQTNSKSRVEQNGHLSSYISLTRGCRQGDPLSPYVFVKVTIIKSLLLSKITHMLLSLPSPNFLSIKELNNTFSNFLWCGEPPKWRKEILEGEICHGGLKLHNIVLFDKTLKIGWLKRFLKSNSKWTRIPQEFVLEQCFIYGPDFIERIMEMTTNRFWLDVLTSLKFLWESGSIQHKDAIML